MCCQSVSFINERGQKRKGVKGVRKVVGGFFWFVFWVVFLLFNFPLGHRELCRYTAIQVKQGKEKRTHNACTF